jgi:hypothetical protein
MIITFILNALYNAIYLILTPIRSLPDATLPGGFTSAIATVSSYVALLYSVLPITCTALLSIFSLVIAYETALLSYKLIKWLYNKIPGVT